MAAAEIGRRRRLMEETTSSACIENGAAISLRRRRMEIRRIKMLTNVAQPVSKRLRPLSGVVSSTNVVHEEEDNMENDDHDEDDDHDDEDDDHDDEDDGGLMIRDGNALASSTCSTSDEWRQRSNTSGRLWSVCGVGELGGDKQAASSLSSAWERPFGGVHRFGDENECANNASDAVGINNNSDRMSSRGSSGSAQNTVEESDVSSSLTSVGGGFQSTFGDEAVVVSQKESSKEAKVSPQGVPTKAAVQEESSMAITSVGPEENSEIADMSSTDTVSTDHVDNQFSDTVPSGAHSQQASQPSGNTNESIPESSVVVNDGPAGGPGVPAICFASSDCPSHGMVSLCGRRREMEDAVVSKDSFVALPCSEVGGCDAAGLKAAPLHYFGVYDGHGGSQVANFCADRLHKSLAEEVETCFVKGQNVDQNVDDWESKWLTAMTQCFKKMDAEVGGFCLEEGECSAGENSRCCPEPIAPETVGTTAIIAVVGACQIIIGNCGDSRAVLSRGGVAIPLSVDHKPEREDEMARVEAAGGRVIYWNGYRVLGVLAMSRAIGDRYLKPYVIADPEIKCLKRAKDDECLVLASDGLWDVMSNEVVCDIARKALNSRRSGHPPPADGTVGTDDDSPAAQAAALLVKLALAKGSSDNISVVVVDLKTPKHR